MTLSIEDATRFAQVFKGLVDGVSVAVLDKRQAVRLALTTMFAGGHLLLDGRPRHRQDRAGARHQRRHRRHALAHPVHPGPAALGHHRRQHVHQKTASGSSTPAPSFAEIVLADEINRASPKTQSALLEVMEEAQVTVDGVRRPAPPALHGHRDPEPRRAGRHLPAAPRPSWTASS